MAHSRRAIRRNLRGLVPPLVQKALNRGRKSGEKPFLNFAPNGEPFIVGEDPLRFQFMMANPIVEVPLEKVMYSGGIRYNRNEHPFVRFFEDGVEAMQRFYARHQPRDICEQHFLPPASNPAAELPSIPWRERPNGEVIYDLTGEHGLPPVHGTKLYGPITKEKLALESDKLTRLHASFTSKGVLEKGMYLKGYMLLDDDGCWAVLPSDGQHRLAVMSHLGHEKVLVRLTTKPMRVVVERDIPYFPMVRLGLITQNEAKAIFRSYTQPFDKPGLYNPLDD